MNFLSRQLVCDRLRITRQQSDRIVGKSTHYGARINGDFVVEVLNRCRVGEQKVLDILPSDLLTAEEVAMELAESEITTRHLALWSNRKRNPIPHYRFNSHTRRYRLADVLKWLEQTSINGGCRG